MSGALMTWLALVFTAWMGTESMAQCNVDACAILTIIAYGMMIAGILVLAVLLRK